MEQQNWEPVASDEPQFGDGKPTSAIHQAEVMGKLNVVSFLCASGITLAGFLGTLYHDTWEAFEVLSSIYLMFFGIMVIILDIPLNFLSLIRMKEIFGKYFCLLTRLTGKGVWFIFLSCMAFATLHTQDMSTLAYIIAVPSGIFGILCVFFGVIKSQKLDKVRQDLRVIRDRGQLEQTVDQYASVSGLSPMDFAQLADDICQIRFSPEDLSLAFNALTCESCPRERKERDMLNHALLDEWLGDGWLLLL